MIQYTIRRLLSSIPVLLGILIVTFALARLSPGDPCTALLGEHATPRTCAAFLERYGLDQPILTQLGIFLRDVFSADLGDSIRYQRPVMLMLVERLPMTIELSLSALVLAIVVGIPAGIIAAIKHNSATDVVTMVFSNIGVSMPVFWLGLMLAYIFALLLQGTPFWLPPSGRVTAGLSAIPFYQAFGWQVESGTGLFNALEFFSNLYIFNSILTRNWPVLWDTIKHLILPSLALGTIPMAIIARMTRSSLLEVLGREYIRSARAKGLPYRTVVARHALRNALLPVVTIIGLNLGSLLGGAVLTETIFGLSGVGRALFEAITSRDYPVIQGFTLVVAVGYVLVNLLVDISYTYLDPRVRLV
ncbi:MAG: peptide ABC transporter permease [Chloroflexi bacterium RBG_13_68_17]|nr:MAG: peptide ABC transporter permease [Chloroflexi bacterium RBG_13_68_17]